MEETAPRDTRDSLRNFLKDRFADTQIVVVSNREPYIHIVEEGEVRWKLTVGGLATALDPVMQAVGGLWVAHGSGEADTEVTDEKGRVAVPPDDPKYTLQRVWLTKTEEEGYYFGFANQAVWPLCHHSFTRPVFLKTHWEAYRQVNQKFADTVADSIADDEAIVIVQDYHFALFPRMLKQRCPQVRCAHFWHIPWPSPELFAICPWKTELLDGLLANDLMGFQLNLYCNTFLDTVDQVVEARRAREVVGVIYQDHLTRVRAFPISVDVEAIEKAASSEACRQRMDEMKRELNLEEKKVFVGLERLDYTKGIPDRMKAFDLMLDRHPELAGQVVFVQACGPSRTRIPQYQSLAREVETLVEEINFKHSQGRWKPIVSVTKNLPYASVLALFRLADVCIVSSLQDGMNLVAKEFASARIDEQGVLVLSRFAGAAQELSDAVLINPYTLDEFSDQLYAALTMDPAQAHERMVSMRRRVYQNTIYTWIRSMLARLADLD